MEIPKSRVRHRRNATFKDFFMCGVFKNIESPSLMVVFTILLEKRIIYAIMGKDKIIIKKSETNEKVHMQRKGGS